MSTRIWLLLLVAAVLPGQSASTNLITTFAGTDGSLANGADALAVPLPPGPWGKPATDTAGNIYFSLTAEHIVLRLTPAGRLERFAGTGFARFNGDGGQAALASLNAPRDIAIDSRGVIYIADSGNRRIRRVLPSGIIDTFAGGGRVVPAAGGTGLAEALLPQPVALAVDGTDNLYTTIDEFSIGRVDYSGTQIRLYAGTPGTGGAPQTGPLAAARFRTISALAADKGGNLYLTDAGAIAIARITQAGRLEVLANRSATFGPPADIAVDAAGVVYFAQTGTAVIWRLAPNNNVEVYAGDQGRQGYSPTGTSRERALFGDELRLTIDGRGALLVGDRRNGRLRRVTATVDALAGTDLIYSGEGGPARAAVFYGPGSIAQARNGTYYFSDAAARAVFSINSAGVLRRFAGSGVLGSPYQDGRAALEGAFGTPYGVAVDGAGVVYVADEDCAIRRIGADGAMRIHAGVPGQCGSTPDGASLKDARFGRLRGLTMDASGAMYVTDIQNHKVWRISADGAVRTFAGTGAPGTSTTSLPAIQAALNTPAAVAVAADRTVYISDFLNNRVVRVGTDGRLTTVVGVGQRASTGDNGPAAQAAVNQPSGLAVDTAGNLYISEFSGHRVRRIAASTGTITTYAGTGVAGYRGDGGFAISALLAAPGALLLNSEGQLLVSDRDNGRIRLVLNGPPAVRINTAAVTVTPVAGEFIQRGAVDLAAPIPGLAYEATARYSGPGAGWLTVSPARGTLPAKLIYETNSAGLAAGDYAGQIVITIPFAAPRETVIPVRLRVPAPPARPFLLVGTGRLTMAAPRGGTAQQTVPILNPGGAPLVVAAAVGRGAFLTVAPERLTIPPGETASFTVTAAAGTAAAGTYSGAVNFSAGAGSATANVSFTISGLRQRLVISQTGLSFRAVAGGPAPAAQVVYAAPADRLAVEVTTVNGMAWLAAAVSGNQVKVTVSGQDLAPGDHYGRLAVFDSAAPAARQFATVLLQVLPAGSDPGPEITPSALLYTASVGGEVAGQDVELVLPTNRQATFSATGATLEGEPWLQFSPAGGGVAGGAPGRVTVQPDLTGLAEGVYRGNVTLQLDDGQTRAVSILAVITPADTKAAGRGASSCSNTGLFPQVLSPAPNFRITVGEPVRLAARVVDGCGNLHQPESGGNAGVAVTGLGSQVVNLTHIGSGVWEGTVTPNALQPAATLTFLGLFSRGTFLQAGADKVNGEVTTAARPFLFAESLTDAASFQFGVPVAPGTLVSVFGENLNPASDVPKSLPLPERLGEVEVRLNDEKIPLLFAGPGQVNAQIPYGLVPDGEYQLEVRRGTAIATPQPVVIAQARPGVFTVDQSGQGQGHIYRALADGSQRLADAAGPAAAGEVLVIYCNGLGLTNPAVTAGAPAPVSPLAVTANPVTVTIGGQAAAIAFAGLAPGFTGLYQINAVVPGGVAPGGAVPVVITVAGQSSVPATIGVR
jgi:uncharacterized protein (TIGR03437 family)